ncbi:Integrator complex subunit 4 [Nymphon striatum]|nr:Integrator complex subunit 4 [Nymphon striatum]
MAAVLKKRALAEYTQVIQEQPEEPPLKILRLRRQKSEQATPEFDLSKATSSQDVLNILTEVSGKLPSEVETQKEMISKLIVQYHKEAEPVVRVKIISLVNELQLLILSEVSADVLTYVDELCSLLWDETSHKVKARLISSLHALGLRALSNMKIINKLINLAKQNLSDCSHQVQCCCLRLICQLASNDSQSSSIIQLVGEYIHSQESRVRCCSLQSMLKLHERGFCLDFNLYEKVCGALQDDFEGARQAALCLVVVFSKLYPEKEVPIPNSLEFNRLIDDAFSKICQSINDLSMKVRVQAASLLGGMKDVSPEFLEQTLDKSLMSNMRRKKSAHERQNESYHTGEWSTGRKWNSDAPKETISEDAVSLMNTGTCGAFVHGLEDEFLGHSDEANIIGPFDAILTLKHAQSQVRSATLDSLCSLALTSSKFARSSLDYLVDMFNDEIEDVRLKAIHCLMKVNSVIVLREDQLETMLCVLEAKDQVLNSTLHDGIKIYVVDTTNKSDFSMDIREALHSMLAACNLSTQQCLKLCLDNLLENLKRYPQDKHTIWRCLQKLGQNHPELTLPLVPEILAIHPFFDTPEPNVEDPAYISVLILVFNAAVSCPTMSPLFEEYTLRHYSYLRHSLSSYVPNIPLIDQNCTRVLTHSTVTDSSVDFLNQVLDRVSRVNSSTQISFQQSVQETAIRDLEKLAEIEPSLTAVSHCALLYIRCQLLFSKILSNKNNLRIASLPLTNIAPITSTVEELVMKTLRLTQLFGGLSPDESACMMQLHCRALGLQLTYVVNTSNTSALSLCDNFLDQIEAMQRYMHENDVKHDSFTEFFFTELSKIEDPKPGAVARLLLPLFTTHQIVMPIFEGDTRNRIHEINATIDEPSGESDNPLKFTAGLVLGVNLDAQIHHIENVKQVRVKVKYPDQQTQFILPRQADFRPQIMAIPIDCSHLFCYHTVHGQCLMEYITILHAKPLQFFRYTEEDLFQILDSETDHGCSATNICE